MLNRAAVLAATAMGLALAACNPPGTANNQTTAGNQAANDALPALPGAVPLQQGDATPIAPAPAASALPAAAPVKVARVAQPADAYAYLDRADGVSGAIGDAPPDYAYDDGDVSPWAWQTDSGDVQYAEPVAGGYRYYYYEPGADTPYLVRDPSYSYGYSGDQLVAVYDSRGALLPPGAYRDRADYASRYYARAAHLYRLSQEREHRGVIAANWAARRAEIAAARAQWSENRARQAEWLAYHQAHEGQEQDHWAQERQQRQAAADRFDQWQRSGFHNPPPPVTGRPGGQNDDRARQRLVQDQRQQQIQQQQAQQSMDRARREGDRQAEEQARQQQRQAAQQNAAQREQATQNQNRLLQHDQDQRLAAQRAAAERQQAVAERQHAQADAQQAQARAAEQRQRQQVAERQQQQRSQAQAEAQQRQSAAREQAQQARAQAAAARQAQAQQRTAAQQHAQQAHEQAAAQHAQMVARAHAEPPRPPAAHPPAPHGGEGDHRHE